MAIALFKGDLAEVSFGKETGLRCDGATWTLTSTSGSTSVITVGTGAYWHTGSGTDVEIPDNILTGCILRIEGGSNFTADDFASTRRSYYITANDTSAGTITVQPAMATSASQAAGASDNLTIDTYRCPTFDAGMSDAANSQKVKSDQFIGLLESFALPEPQIDVRKQHVIGMGRDVNVITSGRETLDGGSMTLNAHNLRWLKYALGGHTAKSQGELATKTSTSNTVSAKPFNIVNSVSAATYKAEKVSNGNDVDIASVATSGTVFSGLDSLSGIATGDNVLIGAKSTSTSSDDTVLVTDSKDIFVSINTSGGVLKVVSGGEIKYASYGAISSHTIQTIADIDSGAATAALAADKTIFLLPPLTAACSIGDTRLNVGATLRALFSVGDYVQIIDSETHQIPGQDDVPPTVFKHEVRRIVATGGNYIHVEEPFTFAHAVNKCGIDRIVYSSDNARGSPNINATTKELQNGVEHTYFGHTTLPSFMIEQSYRNNDATPGGEQLLRLYSGCKVAEATMSANTEGELKLEASYQSARHYTDTGDMFSPHRMFENTANTTANRKVSGIATNGEKPYLFQDISIQAFGRPVLRATEFSVGIANNTEPRWFIRGYEGATATSDHVQHGGSQTPLDITEAKREYTFTFKAMVEDNRFWEELRQRKHHTNTNDITFTLTKPGSATTRETATITIEDYTIVKADHQLPDDKGPIFADIELAVRHMKITENNPYYIM